MSFEEEKNGDLVGSSSLSRKRQRFNVELKEGETVIISWKKLLRDSKEIHEFPPLLNLITQSSSALTTLVIFLHQLYIAHFTYLILLSFGVRARFSDNRQLTEGKRNESLTRKLEDCEKEHRLAVVNGNSMFQKYLSCSNKSSVIRDHQLEGLHDVPVTYPKKYSTYNKHVKVAEDTFVFPLKPKHDVLPRNQRLCFGNSGVNMKAANDLSNTMSHGSPRKLTPLQTYQRSRNLMDGRRSKVNFIP
ncbi:hypothetical protein KSS87_022114 [Heliosperma pusillum]|nr:hypothetical protein KSS87_022114 [Heliosperma pusillum]